MIRRDFLGNVIGGIILAPAIVRAESLMRIAVPRTQILLGDEPAMEWRVGDIWHDQYQQTVTVYRLDKIDPRAFRPGWTKVDDLLFTWVQV